MCLERGMRLDLREVLTIDDNISLGEALFDVADFPACGSMNIAYLRNVARSSSTARRAGLVGRAGIDEGSARSARSVTVHHERHGLILHLDKGGSFNCCLLGGCRDAGHRLTEVAHDWIPRGSL